ncbi:hypothetical protein [Neobacillus terrae]|uniref:hypothetical protein n=1 Tax=Neobacillus terrae TaxID=3034837 RepID=UPI00140D4735|nr:hypothetical protein [Neobacillus terrae]NHM32460.1 hypothetical protein [Neobacillus terrae]
MKKRNKSTCNQILQEQKSHSKNIQEGINVRSTLVEALDVLKDEYTHWSKSTVAT